MRNRTRLAVGVGSVCAFVGAMLVVGGLPARAQQSPSTASTTAQRNLDSLELLRLHANARRAHLEKRADLLVAEWADDFVSVSRGEVSVGNRERGRASFQAYFDASTFQAWDDIVPPRIRISRDGQMATVIVEKRVHLTTTSPAGLTKAARTRFAWLSVYEKRDNRWQLVAIASTDRPDT